MPDHKFTYPRVIPASPKARGTGSSDGRKPRGQRELVAASLVRRPPPRADGRPRRDER